MNTNANRTSRVGLIGVGLMGLGIATNVQRAGWPLNFLQRKDNQPTDDLVAKNATRYTSCQQLAQNSDVIILCVSGSPQVEEVILNEQNGVLKGLKSDAVIIDCSTSIPSSTLKVASAVEQVGGRFMDAPMTRTPKEAMQGRLNLIVGGDRSLYTEQLPLLQSFAENIVYAGPVGSGHKLKLLHNFVSLGFSTVLAEAAACAAKAEVDAEILVEVLARGGGAGVILERLQPYILSQDSSSFRFSIANATKDMGYYRAMTDDLNASSRTARSVLEVLQMATDAGHAQAAMPELISILNDD